MILRYLLRLSLSLRCAWVTALLSNRTIDDTHGDPITGTMPIYTPDNLWADASCPPKVCFVQPSAALAFEQNFHAATYFVNQGPRTVTLNFAGTAIYVFFTLANNVPNAWTETFCAFTLDDQSPEQYHHAPTTSPDYQYQALVYHKTDLANVDHTLLISANDYPSMSFINFDYAIYTFDDGIDTTAQPSSLTSTHDGAVTTTTTTPAPVVTTTSTVTAFDPSKFSSPSSSGTISSSLSSLSPIMSTIGNISKTLGTVETTSLLSAASPLSSNDGTIAPPNNSGGTDNENTLSKASIGAIVGGVVGGSTLVIFIVIFLLRCGRRPPKLSATAHKLTPQQPGCTPFTPLSSADIDTKGSQEAMQLFVPIRKHREVISVPSPENNRPSVASATAGSDMSEMPFQHTVMEKASSIETGFAVSEDCLSGSSHMYQEMRAEIERLQAQLAATLTSGSTDELLPRYSRI